MWVSNSKQKKPARLIHQSVSSLKFPEFTSLKNKTIPGGAGVLSISHQLSKKTTLSRIVQDLH